MKVNVCSRKMELESKFELGFGFGGKRLREIEKKMMRLLEGFFNEVKC